MFLKSWLMAGAVLLAQNAWADGWTTDFTITNLYIAGQNNFQYRVYGMPAVSTCTNGSTWAYLNELRVRRFPTAAARQTV